MKISEITRCNKVTLLCHGILSLIITIACLLEVIEESWRILYFAMIALLALGSVIIETMIYKSNPESNILRKVITYNYVLLYTIAVFTTHSKLTFTYILPMLIVITLYGDIVYCMRIGVGSVLINVADVIYKEFSVDYTKEEILDVEFRILVMALVVGYLVLTTHVSKQNNQDKQQETEKVKIERLVNQVIRLSGGVEQVDVRMNLLDKSVKEMSMAMEEVVTGTQKMAESVQNQLSRIEEIQKMIDEVGEVGVYIRKRMDITASETESDITDMERLSGQSKQFRKSNAAVVSLMKELYVQVEKMNEIIGLKTSILALNANIEAIRAGEAGAGFSMVTKQVSDLAEQTKVATVNITELIGTVTNELNQVTDTVKAVEENTEAQNEKTDDLSKSLNNIKNMTVAIAEKTLGLEKMIQKLSTTNGDIVQNIQNIYAITKEVTAHSGENLNTYKENQEIVGEVSRMTAELNENAKELQSEQA